MNYTTIEQIPLIMSVKEIAAFLGIGKAAVYELIRSGKIQSIHIGNKFRVTKTALLDYLFPKPEKPPDKI